MRIFTVFGDTVSEGLGDIPADFEGVGRITFVVGFLTGNQAIAAFAHPLTVANASDINAFVTAFVAGCP
ncbi:MAG: hypothetical protein AAF235_03780 [Planctomycetota bacterium]